eukprot:TRINITY_DN25542_c0_g1_i1.p1 TRINITY_DN25542_c0_g1~~TRINITY_DN25542_c0_g1_i1.p1  ORF type:complete len:646 (-),score=130.41 TRINITY_DN25542_c0_g1_i1:326-2263(-)
MACAVAADAASGVGVDALAGSSADLGEQPLDVDRTLSSGSNRSKSGVVKTLPPRRSVEGIERASIRANAEQRMRTLSGGSSSSSRDVGASKQKPMTRQFCQVADVAGQDGMARTASTEEAVRPSSASEGPVHHSLEAADVEEQSTQDARAEARTLSEWWEPERSKNHRSSTSSTIDVLGQGFATPQGGGVVGERRSSLSDWYSDGPTPRAEQAAADFPAAVNLGDLRPVRESEEETFSTTTTGGDRQRPSLVTSSPKAAPSPLEPPSADFAMASAAGPDSVATSKKVPPRALQASTGTMERVDSGAFSVARPLRNRPLRASEINPPGSVSVSKTMSAPAAQSPAPARASSDVAPSGPSAAWPAGRQSLPAPLGREPSTGASSQDDAAERNDILHVGARQMASLRLSADNNWSQDLGRLGCGWFCARNYCGAPSLSGAGDIPPICGYISLEGVEGTSRLTAMALRAALAAAMRSSCGLPRSAALALARTGGSHRRSMSCSSEDDMYCKWLDFTFKICVAEPQDAENIRNIMEVEASCNGALRLFRCIVEELSDTDRPIPAPRRVHLQVLKAGDKPHYEPPTARLAMGDRFVSEGSEASTASTSTVREVKKIPAPAPAPAPLIREKVMAPRPSQGKKRPPPRMPAVF